MDTPPVDDQAGMSALVRSIRRDPEHFAERAMLLATARLAEPSWDWAGDIEDRAAAEATLLQESIRVARVDGAISGTPFLIALVPAYVAVLWQQARMTMRIAALHGRDPRGPAMAAELLALRGVHPSDEAAAAALAALEEAPAAREGRRPLRTWIELARRVLTLAGFLDPPQRRDRGTVRRAASAVIGGMIWVGTWVFPLTFMVLMSWTCESATRKLAARATERYAAAPVGGTMARTAERSRRRAVRAALMVLGVAVPLALVVAAVYAGSHGRGVLWLSGIATIAGLALVCGQAWMARR